MNKKKAKFREEKTEKVNESVELLNLANRLQTSFWVESVWRDSEKSWTFWIKFFTFWAENLTKLHIQPWRSLIHLTSSRCRCIWSARTNSWWLGKRKPLASIFLRLLRLRLSRLCSLKCASVCSNFDRRREALKVLWREFAVQSPLRYLKQRKKNSKLEEKKKLFWIIHRLRDSLSFCFHLASSHVAVACVSLPLPQSAPADISLFPNVQWHWKWKRWRFFPSNAMIP